jgi:tRNA(Ile)-lysidine synthase
MNATEQIWENIVGFWQSHKVGPGTIVVGVSGGVDSQVLLHALTTLRKDLHLNLHVATFDHGLRGQSGVDDAAYVEDLARRLGLPVTISGADVSQLVDQYGLNIEEAARQARYTFLMQVAYQQDAEYIAVGHNHDDQAETVLMHLIRGTGLRGLRGMLPVTPLSEYHLLEDENAELFPEDYTLIRPLIDTPRAVIRGYAEENDIVAREDETNDDLTRFRNTLRHKILPDIAMLNPNIKQTLTSLADVVRAEVEVLDGRLESVAAWMLEWAETRPADNETDGGEVVYIDRDAFSEQPLAIQRGLIRKVVFDLSPDTRDLSFDQTEAAREIILQGGTGARIDLSDGLYISVGYDEVMIGYGGTPYYPENLPRLVSGQYVALDLDGQGYIHDNQRLITYWVVEGLSRDLHPADPLECTLAIAEGAKLALRTRRDGDRFRPFGLGGKSQKLSDTFTNLKVPVYYRDQVPLLTVDGEIAWFVVPTATGPVGRIADPFAVRPDSNTILRARWEIGQEAYPDTVDAL